MSLGYVCCETTKSHSQTHCDPDVPTPKVSGAMYGAAEFMMECQCHSLPIILCGSCKIGLANMSCLSQWQSYDFQTVVHSNVKTNAKIHNNRKHMHIYAKSAKFPRGNLLEPGQRFAKVLLHHIVSQRPQHKRTKHMQTPQRSHKRWKPRNTSTYPITDGQT